MRKPALFPVLILAVALFSAPRGAAAFDFNKSSEPLKLSEVSAVPQTPAPAAAAPKICKPFLLSISVGGVSERVSLERACTPENDPVWAIKVERGGTRTVFVKVSSDKYPADRAKIERRIKSMVVDGIGQEDADFIVRETGAALKTAEAAASSEKTGLLDEATEALKVHLSRP
ncbi:MAG: hypothetical protein PHV36_08830 [Elusimicrobiales bacterium]|nr:hypothetical protein [Elusimicrobiales bacterium]